MVGVLPASCKLTLQLCKLLVTEAAGCTGAESLFANVRFL